MPDVVSNDELNALAAEYVLGTLDYQERKGAAALLEVDPTFRGIVRIWERRFGDLHLMVEAVEPDPQVWARIKPKMAGVEQVAPAIPSHADEPAAAAAAPMPLAAQAEAAATTGAAEGPKAKAETEAVAGETPAPAGETPPAEAQPAESKPADSKPAESTPPAVAEAELKLAELAALLPVTGEPGGTPPTAPTAPAEPLPEDGLHTHAPDLVPRGFVPPAPMSTRGAPAVVEVPVHKKGGRGWIAATLAMALVAVALAGLISAWRFFPERLPAQLRANTVLNLTTQAQTAPKARPKLTPFDE